VGEGQPPAATIETSVETVAEAPPIPAIEAITTETAAVEAPTAVLSPEHQKALRAMQRGDYAVAYCIWNPLADTGDAEAQFSLGWMYHNGYGLAIDNSKTLKLWSEAAESGLVNASFALGMLLSEGDRDVERDMAQAVEHYVHAAARGHEDARLMLLHLVQENSRSLRPIITSWGAEEWQLMGDSVRVTVNRANARSQPSLDSQVLTVLERDTELVQIAERQRWLQTVVPERGLIVWVHSSLIGSGDSDQSSAGK